MLAGLIIYRQLNFVSLVNLDCMVFGFPSIGSRYLGSRNDVVFDFDSYKRLGTSGKTACGCMINVLDSNNTNGELATEGLP